MIMVFHVGFVKAARLDGAVILVMYQYTNDRRLVSLRREVT